MKILLINSLIFEIVLSSQLHQNFIELKGDKRIAQPNMDRKDPNTTDDIITADSKKISYVKDDVLVDNDKFRNSITRNSKSDGKFIKSEFSKSDKKLYLKSRKLAEDKGLAKDNKIGKYRESGKYNKKFERKGAINKYGATGYNKKFGSIKEFGLNQDFVFGKNGGFYDSGISSFDYGKKDGLYGARGSEGFKKKAKGDKKRIYSIDYGKRSKKKLSEGKSGFKKDTIFGHQEKNLKSIKNESKKL